MFDSRAEMDRNSNLSNGNGSKFNIVVGTDRSQNDVCFSQNVPIEKQTIF